MSKQEVILCENLESSIGRAVENCPHDRLFILTDDHTHRLCLSQLMNLPFLKDAVEIIIGAGDVHILTQRPHGLGSTIWVTRISSRLSPTQQVEIGRASCRERV